ncbi:hypothetical protein [Paenibacillus gallinarum]|uniref:hypothetical protein n=1 Tax=Paenibacillus gallinarum TaxID=2762232 RepID=UPI00177DA95B|nr:hypothetical protein [Paenibacillus gallinarum]
MERKLYAAHLQRDTREQDHSEIIATFGFGWTLTSSNLLTSRQNKRSMSTEGTFPDALQ